MRLIQGSRLNTINTFYCFIRDFGLALCREEIQGLLVQYGAFAFHLPKARAALTITAFAPQVQVSTE